MEKEMRFHGLGKCARAHSQTRAECSAPCGSAVRNLVSHVALPQDRLAFSEAGSAAAARATARQGSDRYADQWHSTLYVVVGRAKSRHYSHAVYGTASSLTQCILLLVVSCSAWYCYEGPRAN
eukprot:5709073-Pleurochrysis_carterae.AAC.2